tara:strand:- start:371 stop:1228 length:858 start_codon:yes stop_codon:yes gene_type:complete
MNSTGNINELRTSLELLKKNGKTIGLVPTMGNLHDGHINLVKESLEKNDYTVVSIFVNPLQFNPNEDLETYPRTIEEDKEKLLACGCDFLFTPTTQEFYPETLYPHTQVKVPGLSDILCGIERPGHFEGVCTVVTKLLNIVSADNAYFGLKDYQQYLVVKKMAKDLAINTRIVGLEIVRDSDGLALSSRNSFLSDEEICKARQIYRSLQNTAKRIKQSGVTFLDIEKLAYQELQDAGLTPDYFAICNSESLKPATSEDRNLIILAAARVGSTRLIDNIQISIAGH